jgi:hypothetical protein
MQHLIPYLDFVTDGDYEENMQNGYNSVVAALIVIIKMILFN